MLEALKSHPRRQHQCSFDCGALKILGPEAGKWLKAQKCPSDISLILIILLSQTASGFRALDYFNYYLIFLVLKRVGAKIVSHQLQSPSFIRGLTSIQPSKNIKWLLRSGWPCIFCGTKSCWWIKIPTCKPFGFSKRTNIDGEYLIFWNILHKNTQFWHGLNN